MGVDEKGETGVGEKRREVEREETREKREERDESDERTLF